jgi:hypothetical protein
VLQEQVGRQVVCWQPTRASIVGIILVWTVSLSVARTSSILTAASAPRLTRGLLRSTGLTALSFKLHEELAEEHGGKEKWGFRRVEALVCLSTLRLFNRRAVLITSTHRRSQAVIVDASSHSSSSQKKGKGKGKVASPPSWLPQDGSVKESSVWGPLNATAQVRGVSSSSLSGY